MAKRTSLSERRASDARGVDVLFSGAPISGSPASSNTNASDANASHVGALDDTPPSTENEIEPESGINSVQGEIGQLVAAPNYASPKAITPTKPVVAKVTVYIRPEQVIAIESIQLAQRQSTGKKPDKSDLLQEAVDLLIAKYQNVQ